MAQTNAQAVLATVPPERPPSVSVLQVLGYFLRPSELRRAYADEGLSPHIHLAGLLLIVFAIAVVVTVVGLLW